MKSFKDYLTESKKQYDFRIKIAGDMTTENESNLKQGLDKYALTSFKKVGKTPIQQLPLDFPQVKNLEVNIYEVTLDYPTTQFELTEYISQHCGINRSHLAVKRPGEPSEEYQEPAAKREGALLNDPDYKEAGNPKFEDYYGDKYNSGFVKELNELLKLQRKERGEVIPNAGGGEFKLETAIADTNTRSPIQQAPDPRKK
jgi:hypothetical protein